MNILNRTFRNIKTSKSIKRQCHSSSNGDSMLIFIPACIGGIIGMFCDYKWPNKSKAGIPYTICFPLMAIVFVWCSPVLIPGGCLILIDMAITGDNNRE
jgi:hypothetical protein